MSTVEQIRVWFEEGVKEGANHMIVVCDTFSFDCHPVFVKPEDDFWKVHDSNDGPNMQQVMEVYDLKQPREEQLSERRCLRSPPRANV
jgi:hypothetical protein